MRTLLIITLGMHFAFATCAQNDSLQQKIKTTTQLRFMEGEWSGSGWLYGNDRTKKYFSQSEIIKKKVNGQVLMVDGLGHALDSTGSITNRIIHEAFGVISFNADRQCVTMVSYSEMNGRMESDFIILGYKKLQWSFREPQRGMLVRFTEDFSQEGTWKEVGEILLSDDTWYKFFEMNLKKK